MLSDRYPALTNFLGSWFPDADLEGRSDAEAAKAFAGVDPDEKSLVARQAREILKLEEFPWQEVGFEANRYFENEEQARSWLSDILRILENFPESP
jgi:hypothetical protein